MLCVCVCMEIGGVLVELRFLERGIYKTSEAKKFLSTFFFCCESFFAVICLVRICVRAQNFYCSIQKLQKKAEVLQEKCFWLGILY